MSYVFAPLTEEEMNAPATVRLLLEEGTYNFEVLRSTRKISKSGNAMAELNLTIWDKDGKQHNIFDYLVFSTVPFCIKKIKHFCDAVGLEDKYKQGELPEELERLSGKLLLGMQDKQPKPEGGFYPAKNVVEDYLASDGSEKKPDFKDEFKDDDLPF